MTKNRTALLVLATTSLLLASSAFATTILSATPASMIGPMSSPVSVPSMRSSQTLNVPVQVVHVTVRHGGDRDIRLVAQGMMTVHDGETVTWQGESVLSELRAPVVMRPGMSNPHYTVVTDEQKAGETVSIHWDGVQHLAQVDVRTHGLGTPDHQQASIMTLSSEDNPDVEVLSNNGPLIVGHHEGTGKPVTDRHEIDAFFVGGTGGSSIDQVRVWDAVRHSYQLLDMAPSPSVVSTVAP